MQPISLAMVQENLKLLETMSQQVLKKDAGTISPLGKVKLSVRKVVKRRVGKAGSEWLVHAVTSDGRARDFVLDAYTAGEYIIRFDVAKTYKQSTRDPDTFAVHAWA